MTIAIMIALCLASLAVAVYAASKLTHRPPVERYLRCSVTVGEYTVEPGLEWRDGDNRLAMLAQLDRIAASIARWSAAGEPMEVARSREPQFAALWPGRAWFVEVHSADGAWTQIFQPFGVPRNRKETPCRP